MRTEWIYCSNLPGCLPEMEPVGFPTYRDAADYVSDELNGFANGFDTGDDYGDAFEFGAIQAKESTESDPFYWIDPDGYVHTIEEHATESVDTAEDC